LRVFRQGSTPLPDNKELWEAGFDHFLAQLALWVFSTMTRSQKCRRRLETKAAERQTQQTTGEEMELWAAVGELGSLLPPTLRACLRDRMENVADRGSSIRVSPSTRKQRYRLLRKVRETIGWQPAARKTNETSPPS
jgi:hypothetical protein